MKGKKSSGQTKLRVNESNTLMEFLLAKMGGMSRTSVKSLLSHRQVQVNGKIETQYNLELGAGDEIVITKSVANMELTHPKLKVVFEDDEIIVVEKKEGLLTVATMPDSREVTAFSILKAYVRKVNPRGGIYVVHRLDRETSGLLVFAKKRDLQEYMRNNWRNVVTNRAYVALVEGKITPEEDTVISWLTENTKTTRVYNSFTDNGGKKSITHYKTLRSNEEYSLIELHLETGRTNQIRVQMAGLMHPVAGDRKYGYGATNVIDRLALHAYTLEFRHPVTGQKLHFETPIPKGFCKVFSDKK